MASLMLVFVRRTSWSPRARPERRSWCNVAAVTAETRPSLRRGAALPPAWRALEALPRLGGLALLGALQRVSCGAAGSWGAKLRESASNGPVLALAHPECTWACWRRWRTSKSVPQPYLLRPRHVLSFPAV
jgi:hypothetical protein